MKLQKCKFLIVFSALCVTCSWMLPKGVDAGKSNRCAPELQSSVIDNLHNWFEMNLGQMDERFLYRASCQEFFLDFGRDEVVFSFPAKKDANGEILQEKRQFSIRLIGGSGTPEVSGMEPLPFKTNNFVGKNAKRWVRDIPVFSKIKYSRLFPGTDLIFYWENQQLRFDFILDAETDPNIIELEFNGLANPPRIDASGNLLLSTSSGNLRLGVPLTYQIKEDGKKLKIDCNYVLRIKDGKYRAGFEVAAYDKGYPVVIDPVVELINYWDNNGAGATEGRGIAVDAEGNIYVTGITAGPGLYDIFLYKMDPSATQFLYGVIIGGDQNDNAHDIAIDSEGNAIITGVTGSLDFPVSNPFSPGAGEMAVWTNAFLTKFDSQGQIVFSYFLGGDALVDADLKTGAVDYGQGIAVDPANNIYITGRTVTKDFPVTATAFDTALDGPADAFLAKVQPDGNPIYITYLGGENVDVGLAVDADENGNAYVTGVTYSSQFPVTEDAVDRQLKGVGESMDVFVSQFSDTGQLVYSTYIGGSMGDIASGIAVDNTGVIYLGGQTESPDFPITHYFGAPPETQGIFLFALDSVNRNVRSSLRIGGSGSDLLFGLAVDTAGMVYLAGSTDSVDFPCESQANGIRAAPDASKGYVMKVDPQTPAIYYCTLIESGGMIDWAYDVAVDSQNTAYATGWAVTEDISFKSF